MRLWQFEKSIKSSQRTAFQQWRKQNTHQIYQLKLSFSKTKLNKQQQAEFEYSIIKTYLRDCGYEIDK